MGLEILAHEIEHLNNPLIAHRVEDLIAGLTVHDNLLRPQDRKMLGDICLLHAQLLDDRSGTQFAVTQLFKDGNAGAYSLLYPRRQGWPPSRLSDAREHTRGTPGRVPAMA